MKMSSGSYYFFGFFGGILKEVVLLYCLTLIYYLALFSQFSILTLIIDSLNVFEE